MAFNNGWQPGESITQSLELNKAKFDDMKLDYDKFLENAKLEKEKKDYSDLFKKQDGRIIR